MKASFHEEVLKVRQPRPYWEPQPGRWFRRPASRWGEEPAPWDRLRRRLRAFI